MKPASPSKHNIDLNGVIQLHAKGDIEGAERGYRAILASTGGVPEACSNLAIICKATGRLDEAISLWNQALALRRNYPEAHFNLGNALKDKGRLEEAVVSYRETIAINPKFVSAYNNLGLALREQGKLEEAVANYEKALALKPDLAEAHNNLGLALQDLGQYEQAAESYQSAINIAPDAARVHYNLGNVLRDSGKLEQAIAVYKKTITLEPDLADAHNNLGLALERAGDTDEAIASYQQALSITPDNEVALGNFARVTNRHEVSSTSDEVVNLIVRCLENPRIATTEGNATGHAILLQALKGYIEGDIALDLTTLAHQTSNLLVASLMYSFITNPQLEDVLVRLRGDFLKQAQQNGFNGSKQETCLKILKALAQQSFLNEYVWEESDEESHIVQQLEERIVAMLSANDIPADDNLFLLASYRPIHQNEAIRDWCLQTLPNLEQELRVSLSHLILNPVKEAELAATIEQITPIDDDISLTVQAQYEANPYPRWDSLTIKRSRPYIELILREIFPHRPKLKAATDTPHILSAGCGTGIQPISTALRLNNSNILATDLSRTSLAYAKRKAEEMNVTNIRFALADILKLGELDERFDVIESSGVLHHMAEPKRGLSALLNLLKSGGFIKLALYSDIARQPVVQLREKIKEQGLEPNLKGIRAIRKLVKTHDDFGRIQKSTDFYNSSGIRDMLFHVQEHRFTLPQLSDLLEECKLEFLGFLIPNASVIAEYARQFPDDPDCLNLKHWHTFEQQYPVLFGRMYQFWCRKTD